MADHHGAPGKAEQRVLEGTQRVDVEVVRRLVEQEHVPAALQHLGQLHPVALAAGELTDLLLLVAALEAEARRRRRGAWSSRLPTTIRSCPPVISSKTVASGVEGVAGLVDVGELHGRPDLERTGVGLLLADDHAEQRRLAGAVGPDDPDDAARAGAGTRGLDQQAVAEALHEPVRVDHPVAEARARAGW